MIRIASHLATTGQLIKPKYHIDQHCIRQFRAVYAYLRSYIPASLTFNIDETQINTFPTRTHTKYIGLSQGN